MALLPLAFVAFGLFFVYLGVKTLRASATFERVAQPTEAEITDIRWETRGPVGDSSRVAFAVLRFALPDGRTVETQADYGATFRPGRVGDRVPILYHPDDPTRARLARGFTGAAPRILGVILLVFGGLFALAGGAVFAAVQALT
jgi:hypothetical protein